MRNTLGRRARVCLYVGVTIGSLRVHWIGGDGCAVRHPSTWAWFTVHVITPLVPFFLEGGIRTVVYSWCVSLGTFNASTLAMSIGFVSLFVSQSIRMGVVQLADETERDSIAGASAGFAISAVYFFVLFGLLVLLATLVNDQKMAQLAYVLQAFEWVTYVTCTVPVVAACAAQRSFKLRAALL